MPGWGDRPLTTSNIRSAMQMVGWSHWPGYPALPARQDHKTESVLRLERMMFWLVRDLGLTESSGQFGNDYRELARAVDQNGKGPAS